MNAWNRITLAVCLLLAILGERTIFIKGCPGCGGYIRAIQSGNLTTPGYPHPYPNNSMCIWLLEAPDRYRVELTVHTFRGQVNENEDCADFLKIRDGSKSSELLLYACNSTKSEVISSTARWLWIQFKSDGVISGTGLTATWKATYTGLSYRNMTSPVAECRSYQFTCANKECISQAYRCDGNNDCGCIHDCDESGCAGFDISYGGQLAIGIGIGVALFVVLFCGTLFVEWKKNWARLGNDRRRRTHKHVAIT